MKIKQQLDTPRNGKNWCDVINKEHLVKPKRDVIRFSVSKDRRYSWAG